MSIVEILNEKRDHERLVHGVMVGIVTNNSDPEELGRVKVKLPHMNEEDESAWARVATIMAGKEIGAFFLPEIEDEVLVGFEEGKIDSPYIIGSLWNGLDVPPETNSNGENNIRIIKSRSGHVIKIDDKDGEEKIEIVDKSEKNLLTINTSENKITIASDQDIDILAPNGKVFIDSNELEIKSAGDSKIESGGNLDMEASGDMNAKGSTINLN